jgi:multicomponent Na+:H+ antiporter subunit G
MSDWLAAALLVTGSLFLLMSAVGLLRLPDFLCRMHAVAKGTALGISLILLAIAVRLGFENAGLKVALAILFQLVTIPVSGHLLTQIAWRKNLPRWSPPSEARGRGTDGFKDSDRAV